EVRRKFCGKFNFHIPYAIFHIPYVMSHMTYGIWNMESEPTHARRALLGLVFALTVITYLDRLCISSAMPRVADEFKLTPDQKGWVFSAFTFAYAAFEIPSGWLG